MSNVKPINEARRIEILDALRGFALFGILPANLVSFIGYSTYSPSEIITLPTLDFAVLFFIDWLIEGKFYGIFSILFGVGFALQAQRAQEANVNFKSFWYKRMIVLCCIGILHMYLVWHGDILTLYGLLGMFLPLFLKLSNRSILNWVFALLVTPILIHCLLYLTQDSAFWGSLNRFASALKVQLGYESQTLLEMRTSNSALEVFYANILKAIPRPMSYLLSGRYFQVLGLFLIGLLIAKHWLPKIRNHEISVPAKAVWLGSVGLIASFGYAVIKGTIGTPFELSHIGLIQGVIYHIGSTCLALGISMLFIHTWASGRLGFMFRNLALLGRMALTNYILQNTLAVLLFFGYGFALMGNVSFFYTPFIAFSILLVQWVLCKTWLGQFKQGPLEYIWRKMTYNSRR